LTNQQNDSTDELVELRRRVAMLEEELKARDAFIVAAAHELRNPISPLVLHVQRLVSTTRNATDDHVSARWLGDQLDVFGRRLSRFLSALNRMLDVSQIRGGRIDLVLEEVDLAELAREVVASFEREIAASTSALSLHAEQSVTGSWDRMRLEQIVANLVSNAIRYGDGKPISVTVLDAGAEAQLIVADRGIGIREADQTRIFERFERANSMNRSGFGVGLWVVRQLCHVMGGNVSVVSRTGEGSTFTVTLPRSSNGRGE
jgi:signal transduction histidine kinase